MMSEYEFSQKDNAIFENLTKSMRTFGVLTIIVGIIGIAATILIYLTISDTVGSAIAAIISVIILLTGITIFRPADNFTRIASSAGSDISELMNGLGELNARFGILVWLAGIGLIIILGEIVYFLVFL